MGFFGKLFGTKKAMSPAEFWAWFAANAQRFERRPDQVPVDDFSQQLARVHPGLAFVLGPAPQGGHELEISADGKRDLIPIVTDVVGAAPPIPGWVIHAFRRPHPGLSIQLGDRTVDAQTVFFDARPNGNALDVIVYIDDFDRAPDAVGNLAFVLLDSTIGELAVMTKIIGLDFVDATRRTHSARPLDELPAALAQAQGN